MPPDFSLTLQELPWRASQEYHCPPYSDAAG